MCYRKERRDKHSEKERKKNRLEEMEDDEYRYSRHRKPGGSQKPTFRHDQPIPSHSDHDRWLSSMQRSEYKRSFEYARPPYHREREYPRPDKRHAVKFNLTFFIF